MKQYYVLGNSSEWCYYSWKGVLDKDKTIHFYNDIVPIKGSSIIKSLCNAHYSQRLNKKWRLPFKCIWFNKILKSININEENENYLIVYDRNKLLYNLNFFSFVRKKKPGIKIFYLFSNIVKYTGANELGILNKLNLYFDQVFAFDKVDAEKFNFSYFPLIYTPCMSMDSNYPECDLFYIGKAKDRYDQLIKVFEKAQLEGLKCDFNIVGVPKEKQLYSDIIHYDHFLSYDEVLNRIMNSKCLVDMIQGQSTAFTIKTCEAIIYNKKLITSNENVKDEIFYNEDMILVFTGNESISDFLSKKAIPFSDKSKSLFSPYTLFNNF